MASRLILIYSIWGLLGSCALPPHQELAEARAELARASVAGAEQLAPDDYGMAVAALRDGEDLIAAGDYRQARELLPNAISYARRAQLLSRETGSREEPEADRQPPDRTDAHRRSTLPTGEKPAGTEAKSTPLPLPALPPTHTVRDGETLWTIAGTPGVYGDPLLWPLLYQANRDQIKDPSQVFAGQVLTIPRGATVAELGETREKAKASRLFPVKNLPGAPPPSSQ